MLLSPAVHMVSPNPRTHLVCLKLKPKMAGTSQRTRLCSYSLTHHSKGSSQDYSRAIMVVTTQDGYGHFNFVPTVCKKQWNQNHRMLLVGL